MAGKVSNFSDLIQRVAASCLLHPLAAGRHDPGNSPMSRRGGDEEDEAYENESYDEHDEDDEEEQDEGEIGDGGLGFRAREDRGTSTKTKKEVIEMEMAMREVFDAVSAMKKAYVNLQEAHSPWDQEKLRTADVAVVGELRKLGVLRERFRRRCTSGGGGGVVMTASTLREVVAPYEAAVEELKREVKSREVEIQNLMEKLNGVVNISHSKKGRSLSRRKVGCSSQTQVAVTPAPELFEATMSQVREASKSFTSLLLSLMRGAHWDIAAAVRSIEAAAATAITAGSFSTSSIIATQNGNARYALQSYISRKLFQGFDHETFYMDGSLSSLLNPEQHRRDCFAQYRDFKAMDPTELLGILPTCQFGKFCSAKYLAIVHPKMEESLFGDLEQRRHVVDGGHPRSEFYGEFLGLAKAVWLLHLLAFSLDPAPSQFEASRGAEFHQGYMESVGKFAGGRVPSGQVVGFPVSPGFKLGNGSVIKARVYLVNRN
ncbi:protein GRAVITROPIC IN THE LIGHT 1 [Prunus avium]|uniref:Protein GRAVITROPIC IN THE LIGHT 1 n=1 Tax=Prunus avium TaxID=42229 RepID=A0A6P5SWD6_PRUAV|nr:protein GRAVITROPIC IN THE LIGHT 1 [Prunus avium]